jgi:acyl dehydratase
MTADPSERLYLDDLSVGDVFTSDTCTVDEAAIIAFAQEFDPQPFHLDPEAAKQTFFGGLAASGWHTAALTMRLLVTSGLPLADGVIGAGGELSWPRPTRPRDVLRVVATVTEIVPSRSRPERALVHWMVETLNQDDEPVQRLAARLVVSKRGS